MDDKEDRSPRSENDVDREKVCYSNLPKHSRFKPKQSGNRKGRPPGAKGRKKIVQEIAMEVHEIEIDGAIRRLSTIELVILSLRALALKPNVRAFRAWHKLLAKYGPQEPVVAGGYLIVPETLTFAEWQIKAQRVERNIADIVRTSKW